MTHLPRWTRTLLTVALLIAVGVATAQAQGRGKKKSKTSEKPGKISVELVLSSAQDVLKAEGFDVIKVETKGDLQIVHYRAGNQGKGKGKGPPRTMVIRRVDNGFELKDAPVEVKLKIELKLGIKLF